MMSRTTRAGLRLQWKNNLGFNGLRRLGFCSIKSIIKQTKFLMPGSIAADILWSDRIQYRRSMPPRSKRTEPERGPAGGHRYCLGTGAVANTLPRLPKIVISETEKTKPTMQVQPGRTS